MERFILNVLFLLALLLIGVTYKIIKDDSMINLDYEIFLDYQNMDDIVMRKSK